MKKATFFIALMLLAVSCKKDTEDTTPDPVVTPPTTNNYPGFSGAIDGTTVSIYSTTEDNGYGYSSSFDYPNDVMSIDYSADFAEYDAQFNLLKAVSVGVSGFNHAISVYDAAFFQNSIATAPIAFYAEGSSSVGYEFSYGDAQGNFWSSRYGTQAGSTLTITTNEAASTVMNTARRLVKGTVSCKLYNEQTGEIKNVTNATFKAYLHEYEM